MKQVITQASEWFNKLQTAGGNGADTVWDDIQNVKTGIVGLTCEPYAYAEFADGSLLADNIEATTRELQEIYTNETELLKDLSDQQEAAMWQLDELDAGEVVQAVHAELNGYHGPALTARGRTAERLRGGS